MERAMKRLELGRWCEFQTCLLVALVIVSLVLHAEGLLLTAIRGLLTAGLNVAESSPRGVYSCSGKLVHLARELAVQSPAILRCTLAHMSHLRSHSVRLLILAARLWCIGAARLCVLAKALVVQSPALLSCFAHYASVISVHTLRCGIITARLWCVGAVRLHDIARELIARSPESLAFAVTRGKELSAATVGLATHLVDWGCTLGHCAAAVLHLLLLLVTQVLRCSALLLWCMPPPLSGNRYTVLTYSMPL
jgi:hypothetical protein